MAKRPGVQAAAEKGASAVVGALAGSSSFMGAGTLSLDEVFSPEQLAIDREIADYALRVAQGFEFDADKLSVEIIAACAEDGAFLAHDSTQYPPDRPAIAGSCAGASRGSRRAWPRAGSSCSH
jgi:trimethylamine:corrinoid methyltransferase-like protein